MGVPHISTSHQTDLHRLRYSTAKSNSLLAPSILIVGIVFSHQGSGSPKRLPAKFNMLRIIYHGTNQIAENQDHQKKTLALYTSPLNKTDSRCTLPDSQMSTATLAWAAVALVPHPPPPAQLHRQDSSAHRFGALARSYEKYRSR